MISFFNQLNNLINVFVLYFLHISVKIKTAIVDLTKAALSCNLTL